MVGLGIQSDKAVSSKIFVCTPDYGDVAVLRLYIFLGWELKIIKIVLY